MPDPIGPTLLSYHLPFDAWKRGKVAKTTWEAGWMGNKKSALDFSVQDASAALPQNCQTTKWILENYSFGVNVTLVIGFFRDKGRC